jgi:hypothetical protein
MKHVSFLQPGRSKLPKAVSPPIFIREMFRLNLGWNICYFIEVFRGLPPSLQSNGRKHSLGISVPQTDYHSFQLIIHQPPYAT